MWHMKRITEKNNACENCFPYIYIYHYMSISCLKFFSFHLYNKKYWCCILIHRKKKNYEIIVIWKVFAYYFINTLIFYYQYISNEEY